MSAYQSNPCGRAEHIARQAPKACSSCGGSMGEPLPPDAEPVAFDFISTPEDAWLLVSEHLLLELIPDFAPASASTRRSAARVFALAEEPDAIRFMDAWQDKHGSITVRENRYSIAFVADWPAAGGAAQ